MLFKKVTKRLNIINAKSFGKLAYLEKEDNRIFLLRFLNRKPERTERKSATSEARAETITIAEPRSLCLGWRDSACGLEFCFER